MGTIEVSMMHGSVAEDSIEVVAVKKGVTGSVVSSIEVDAESKVVETEAELPCEVEASGVKVGSTADDESLEETGSTGGIVELLGGEGSG
jgi:hypothetical protein